MGEHVGRFQQEDILSEGIRNIWKLLDIGQTEMGEWLGVDQGEVSRIVNGRSGAPVDVIIKLQRLLEKYHNHNERYAVENELNKIRNRVLELTVGINQSQTELLTSFSLTPELINFIYTLYKPYVEELGGTLLERGCLKYPAAFFPAGTALLHDMLPKTNVFTSENHTINIESLMRDTTHRLARLARNGEEEQEDSESGWNLSMTSMSMDAGYPVLELRLANYNQIVDSSDSMIYEIRRVFSEQPAESIALSNLPLRSRVHEREGNPLSSARHRATGIGIAAPLCFYRPHNNTLATIIEKRSDRVGTYQRALHVIPAGMLGWRFIDRKAPHTRTDDPSYGYEKGDVELGMLVEYVEELFGRDLEAPETSDRLQTRSHERIQTLMNTCQAEIIPTGVCIDLLNLRPEICAVILVCDPRWWQEEYPQVKLNWESLDHDKPNRQHNIVSLAPTNELPDILRPEITLPSGAGAFWYASDVAQRVWKERLNT